MTLFNPSPRPRDRRRDAPQTIPPVVYAQPPYAPTERYVSEATVLGTPAAGWCADRICNALGEMSPLRAVAEDTGRDMPTTPDVIVRPWARMRPTEYITMATRSLVLRGRFIALPVGFDQLGLPTQLVPVHPDRAQLTWASEGPIAMIDGRRWDGPLFGIMGPRMPGDLVGMGVVERYRRSLAHGDDQAAYSSNTMRTGGVPTVVVKLPEKAAKPHQIEQLEERWQGWFGGATRKPLFAPKEWEVDSLSFSPGDLQFLESRRFTVAEIALMFGFDPADLNAAFAASGPTQTYTNRQDRNQDLLRFTYGPWVSALEEAFSEVLPVGQAARFNPESLLRLTTRERYEAYKLAIEAGWMTVEEVRRREGLDPMNEEESGDGRD